MRKYLEFELGDPFHEIEDTEYAPYQKVYSDDAAARERACGELKEMKNLVCHPDGSSNFTRKGQTPAALQCNIRDSPEELERKHDIIVDCKNFRYIENSSECNGEGSFIYQTRKPAESEIAHANHVYRENVEYKSAEQCKKLIESKKTPEQRADEEQKKQADMTKKNAAEEALKAARDLAAVNYVKPTISYADKIKSKVLYARISKRGKSKSKSKGKAKSDGLSTNERKTQGLNMTGRRISNKKKNSRSISRKKNLRSASRKKNARSANKTYVLRTPKK